MLSTSEYYLTSEIAYRRERIARDWAAASTRRPTRPASSRPRWPRLHLPAHRTKTATPA